MKKLTFTQTICLATAIFIIIVSSVIFSLKGKLEKEKNEQMLNPQIAQNTPLNFKNILQESIDDSLPTNLYAIKSKPQKNIIPKKQKSLSLVDSLRRIIKTQSIEIAELKSDLKKAKKSKLLGKTPTQQVEEIDYEAHSIKGSSELTQTPEKKKLSPKEWVKLEIYEERTVKNQSIVRFYLPDAITLESVFIHEKAKFEGVCSIKNKRLHINFQTIYTRTDEIRIEGTAYTLNKTPGLNALVKQNKDLVKAMGKHTKTMLDYIDNKTGLLKTAAETNKNDIPSPFYAKIPEGLEIFAYVSLKGNK